jgi:non-specific serine/threonine protein kinase
VYERVCTELERHLDEQAFASMRARASRLRPAAVVAYALGTDDALQLEDPLEGLTPREREVARLAANGLRNREIARTLVITEGTARVHVEHVLAKLDLRSRAQIAAWAVEHGLFGNVPDGFANGIW